MAELLPDRETGEIVDVPVLQIQVTPDRFSKRMVEQNVDVPVPRITMDHVAVDMVRAHEVPVPHIRTDSGPSWRGGGVDTTGMSARTLGRRHHFVSCGRNLEAYQRANHRCTSASDFGWSFRGKVVSSGTSPTPDHRHFCMQLCMCLFSQR